MKISKIKVEAQTKQGWMWINERDFDNSKHVLYVPKTKTRKKKISSEQVEANADIKID